VGSAAAVSGGMDSTGAGPGAAGTAVVDAHHHVWDLAAHEQPWLRLPGNERLLRNFTEAEMRPQAVAAGVTASVVVQTVTEQSETLELLDLASGSDLVTGVVGWVDLQSPGVADALAELKAGPNGAFLCGIRHPVLIEDDPQWLARPGVLAGLAAVAAAGLCYDFVGLPHHLPAALAAATAVPGLTFVLDHCGNPPISPEVDQGWARAVGKLAALPNTACKLSGILAEPPPGGDLARAGTAAHLVPYYEAVLGAFGADRLMFGSDWPPCTLTSTYAGVVAAARELTPALSPTEREAVFSGIARQVYQLTTTG
jgi:L-fucono-1,5-lactonase